MSFVRVHGETLSRRLTEPRRFIQIVAGPRQVGKTTMVRQVVERLQMPVRSGSCSWDPPPG